jgi:hypothetical protein
MLYHLLSAHNQLIRAILPILNKEEGSSLSLNALEKSLMVCREQTWVRFNFCFFIDALDENDTHKRSREKMVGFINRLVDKTMEGWGKVKICAASRPDNDIELRLKRQTGLRMQDWSHADIRAYVWERLKSHPVADRESEQTAFHQQLAALCWVIVRRAQGVFLWVRLVVDSVHEGMSRGELLGSIQRRVQNLPDQELSDFFLDILSETPKETRAETFAILEIVVCAKKSVTILYIAILLEAVLPAQCTTEDTYSAQLDTTTLKKCGPALERRIREATGGLVQIVAPRQYEGVKSSSSACSSEPRSGFEKLRSPVSLNTSDIDPCSWTVQLLHQTIKEFLITTNSRLSTRIDEIVLLGTNKHGPCLANDHVYILQVISELMQFDKTSREQLLLYTEPETMVLRHGSDVDRTKGAAFFELLKLLDRRLTRVAGIKRSCWPEYVTQTESRGRQRFSLLQWVMVCNVTWKKSSNAILVT